MQDISQALSINIICFNCYYHNMDMEKDIVVTPLMVAVDGIDKSGKTTVLPKIKDLLQKSLGLRDDEIGIIKFDVDELE